MDDPREAAASHLHGPCSYATLGTDGHMSACRRKRHGRTHTVDVPQNRILVPHGEFYISNVLFERQLRCRHPENRQQRDTNAFREVVAGRRRYVARQPHLRTHSINWHFLGQGRARAGPASSCPGTSAAAHPANRTGGFRGPEDLSTHSLPQLRGRHDDKSKLGSRQKDCGETHTCV